MGSRLSRYAIIKLSLSHYAIIKYELKKLKNCNDEFLRIKKSKRDQQKYTSFLKSPFSLPKIERCGKYIT